MTASHPSQKHIVEKTSGTAQPLPNRHWPQQVITTLGGREEIVHVAMPEEDKRDATLPRLSGWLLMEAATKGTDPKNRLVSK